MSETKASGGVDGVSVYGLANKPTVAALSPMDVLTQAGQTAALVNANRLFQARVAAGQVQQQAINPDTGDYDPRSANRLLSQAPAAAAVAAEGIGQNQALQGQQQALSQNRAGVINSMITPLLTVPDGALHDAAAETLQRAVTQGLIPADQATALALKLPNDPVALRKVLQQTQLSAMAPESRQAQIYGTPGAVDNGGFNIPTVTASPMMGGGRSAVPGAVQQLPGPQFINDGQQQVPTSGGRAVGGGFQTQLSPSELAAPMQIGIDAKGAPIMGTRAQFLARAQGQSPLGNGRMPAALLNPNKPAAAPDAAPAADGGNGVVTGLGPAQASSLTAQGGASAAAFQQIADQGVQAKSQNAILGNMLGDTTQFTSGMNAVNNFKTTLQRQAPAIAQAFGIDPKQVASMESFDKLAAQIASQQGAGSDARLAVAQSGNPSSKLSKEGVDLMLRQLQGNADYLQARAAVAAKYPDQSDRAGFEASAGSQLDPRAFQFARMTQPQRVDYVKGLSATDKAAVQRSYNFAHSAGILDTPAPAASQPARRGY